MNITFMIGMFAFGFLVGATSYGRYGYQLGRLHQIRATMADLDRKTKDQP